MHDLPPIPTPFSQRWREFKIQVLPVLVFLLTVGLIAYLWRNYVSPTGVVGEVEAVRANVISTTEGTLVELIVARFEAVVKDQPLGQLITTDPAVAEVALRAIAADLKLMQARMELDKQRNLDSLLRQRLDLLNEQVALEIAKVRLPQAEAEFQRATKLYADQLIPEGLPETIGPGLDPGRFNFGFDVARRDRDALQVEITRRAELVAKIEENIQRLQQAGVDQIPPTDPVIEENIRVKQEELRLIQKPHLLKAPLDGMVSMVFKRPGEKVVRGEIILTITSPAADRIVGYMRQPISDVPTTNDTVTVSTRTQPRQVGKAQILAVGAQLEPINPLLLSPSGNLQEVGLPILVTMPSGLRLVPGEHVDLAIRYSKR